MNSLWVVFLCSKIQRFIIGKLTHKDNLKDKVTTLIVCLGGVGHQYSCRVLKINSYISPIIFRRGLRTGGEYSSYFAFQIVVASLPFVFQIDCIRGS